MANTKGKPTGGKRAAAPADPPEVREAGAVVNPATAKKSARQRAASPAAPGSYAESAQRRRAVKETDRLSGDLREFAAARPGGWGHDDWLAFVESLKGRGHDTSNPDGIGRLLERERLATVLAAVPGLGPKRVEALVARYETLWSMRHADAGEVARIPGIPRALAERVVEEVRAR